jgi:integrase
VELWNLRHSTWSVYEGHTKNHFSDIEHLKINRVTIQTVEKWISDRQEAGMNILTLRKILVTFNQIMSYAVRHQYIANNPLKDAERPRGQGSGDEEDSKIIILIKYIQTQLGHSSPTVTLNVYAHLMKRVNQEAARRLENSIFKADGHKLVTNG